MSRFFIRLKNFFFFLFLFLLQKWKVCVYQMFLFFLFFSQFWVDFFALCVCFFFFLKRFSYFACVCFTYDFSFLFFLFFLFFTCLVIFSVFHFFYVFFFFFTIQLFILCPLQSLSLSSFYICKALLLVLIFSFSTKNIRTRFLLTSKSEIKFSRNFF